MLTCDNCFGARAVPSLFGDYEACPDCVVDAGHTFVVFAGSLPEAAEEG